MKAAILRMRELLENSDGETRSAAIDGLSALGAHGLCQRPRPVVVLIPFFS